MQSYNSKIKIDIKTRAYRYALRITQFVDNLQKGMSTEIIARQLLKSATSIGANIIEAQAASSRRDFTNFLNYALKSANETRFWLGLLRDTKKSPAEVVGSLLEESKELANILAASILTLKGKR